MKTIYTYVFLIINYNVTASDRPSRASAFDGLEGYIFRLKPCLERHFQSKVSMQFLLPTSSPAKWPSFLLPAHHSLFTAHSFLSFPRFCASLALVIVSLSV